MKAEDSGLIPRKSAENLELLTMTEGSIKLKSVSRESEK